jgi:hypothetical protein
MSFCKNGIVDFNTIDEVAPYNYMKTKIMPDGSSWARIHWLDVSSTKEFFANDIEVDYCVNKLNRFSLMGKVDFFRELGSLPEGYKKLTYIASSGTQYIDTGYYWTHEKTRIFFKGIPTGAGTSQTLFGSEEYTASSGNARNFAHILHGGNGSYGLYLGSSSNGNISIPLNQLASVDINTSENKNVNVKVNNTVVMDKTYSGSVMNKQSAYLSSSASTTVGHIFIFSNHNSNRGSSNGPTQNVAAMRLYEFKMWDNDKLVRNFIPCKNASGTVGLWDTVTNSFFTTPTGSFIAGTELADLSVSNGGSFEFMLTYPRLSNGYNRWRQINSPNDNWSASGTGLVNIHTDFTTYKHGLKRTNSATASAVYTCSNSDNWWAPIGQKTAYSSGIPAADGSTQFETELWVRIDCLHPDTIKLITSPEFYSSTAAIEPARIVEEKEIQATRIIES